MKTYSLNEIYERYLNKEITKKELEGLIYNYFLKNKRKTIIKHWKDEDYEDFVSSFYPKIQKVIKNYHDTGNSFDSFIYKIFNIASKEYKIRSASKEIIEYTTWNAKLYDHYAHENPPEYNILDNKNLLPNSKRILTLILKCYNYVSEDYIEKIAPKIGIDKNEIIRMIDEIRSLRVEKDEKIQELKEKTFSQYYRCISIENQLLLSKGNAEIHSYMKDRQKSARRKLNLLRKKLKTVKQEATNRQIAEVIGISKGTVDASLHKLREKFKVN